MAKTRIITGDGYTFETITVADTAIGFTAATWRVSPATVGNSFVRAHVTATGGAMRYRYDGTSPTSSVGHMLSHGDSIDMDGTVNISNFKAIRSGANNGTLHVTYEVNHG